MELTSVTVTPVIACGVIDAAEAISYDLRAWDDLVGCNDSSGVLC